MKENNTYKYNTIDLIQIKTYFYKTETSHISHNIVFWMLI